jgi:hypothetical protein
VFAAPHGAQALAADAGDDIRLRFAAEERPGYYAAVNERAELAEIGWATFPKLMTLGWAAQWLLYEAELRRNLSRPALTVPVFNEEVRAQDSVPVHVAESLPSLLICHRACRNVWHAVHMPALMRLRALIEQCIYAVAA